MKDTYSQLSTEYLMKLGFHIGFIGFDYLKEAIDYCLEDQGLLDCITTRLYPMVAKRFGVKNAVVERGIRNTIERAYKGGGLLEINTLYNKVIYQNDFKFSNSEFIALMVYRIKLDIAKKELAKKYNIKLPDEDD